MNVIDTHSHWFPQEWVDVMEKKGAANGAKIGKNARGQLTFHVPGMSYVFKREYTDLDIRFKAMDDAGITLHALSLTSPTVYWAPPEFGLELSRLWNDKCSEVVMKYSQRFIGLATVPMQAPELALPELGRASKLPGLRGVIDAFPKLDVVLVHAGGAFPALVGRMDHGAAVRAEAKLPHPPSSYVRRFYYDTITHNDQILMNLIRQMGVDRILLGSDHPADMGNTRPADVVRRLTELSANERDMILGGNAARLLKL